MPHDRTLVVDEAGKAADRPALEVARTLATPASAPHHTPLVSSRHDPEWLADHAAALARANNRWITSPVRAATRMGPEPKERVLHDLATIAPEQVRAALQNL